MKVWHLLLVCAVVAPIAFLANQPAVFAGSVVLAFGVFIRAYFEVMVDRWIAQAQARVDADGDQP